MEATIGRTGAEISKGGLWTGRVISTLIILFMLFDGGTKIARLKPVVDAMVKSGYAANLTVVIGVLALISAILYAIPRTSIFGAIVLTGFLGGATDSVVRLGQPLWWLPVTFGVLTWFALYLREPRLRALIPFRQ